MSDFTDYLEAAKTKLEDAIAENSAKFSRPPQTELDVLAAINTILNAGGGTGGGGGGGITQAQVQAAIEAASNLDGVESSLGGINGLAELISNNIGYTNDITASSDTGSFNLIQFFKRILSVKLPNLINNRLPVDLEKIPLSDTISRSASYPITASALLIEGGGTLNRVTGYGGGVESKGRIKVGNTTNIFTIGGDGITSIGVTPSTDLNAGYCNLSIQLGTDDPTKLVSTTLDIEVSVTGDEWTKIGEISEVFNSESYKKIYNFPSPFYFGSVRANVSQLSTTGATGLYLLTIASPYKIEKNNSPSVIAATIAVTSTATTRAALSTRTKITITNVGANPVYIDVVAGVSTTKYLALLQPNEILEDGFHTGIFNFICATGQTSTLEIREWQ